ncbi:hypothetical protein Tco_0321906 [Tanacetum coccineum]
MFLGYKVNTKGIKVCPDKVEAVLDLPSQKCLKVLQRLNRKLASLNRFLAKSAERSLSFFKTLKKCTKKSDDVPSPSAWSMGIRHAKPCTLRGGPSTKLGQRSDSQTHVLHLYWDLPAKIEIVVIQGLATQHPQEELFDLIKA